MPQTAKTRKRRRIFVDTSKPINLKDTGKDKAIKRYVKGQVTRSKETHFTEEFSTSGAAVTSTVAFHDLTDSIAQGAGGGSRPADKIWLQKFKGAVWFMRDGGATANSYDFIRFIIFQWRPDDNIDSLADANNATGLNKILSDNSSTTTYFLSAYIRSKSKTKKFKILHDSSVVLGTREAGSENYPGGKLVRVNIPKKSMSPINFNLGATSGKNKIYMMIIGSQASGADNSTAYMSFAIDYKV